MRTRKVSSIFASILCAFALVSSFEAVGMDQESEAAFRNKIVGRAHEALTIIKAGLPTDYYEDEETAFEELKKALHQKHNEFSRSSINIFLTVDGQNVNAAFIRDTSNAKVSASTFKFYSRELALALDAWKKLAQERAATRKPTPSPIPPSNPTPLHTPPAPVPPQRSFARTLGEGALFTTVTGTVAVAGYYLYTRMQERTDEMAEDQDNEQAYLRHKKHNEACL